MFESEISKAIKSQVENHNKMLMSVINEFCRVEQLDFNQVVKGIECKKDYRKSSYIYDGRLILWSETIYDKKNDPLTFSAKENYYSDYFVKSNKENR